jgi:hypothetical protein
MHVKDSSVVEVKQLMLATPFDVAHSRPSQSAKDAAGDPPPKRRMKQSHARDGRTANRGAKIASRSLDFRQLGHAARSKDVC